MNVTRIFDIFNRFEEFPDTIGKMFFSEKIDNKWHKYDTKQYKEYSDNFSCGLLAMGFKKGDKIATITNNRPQWNFVEMGISQIGAVHVPVYPTIGKEEFDHILRHSDAKLVIVSDNSLYKKTKPIIAQIPFTINPLLQLTGKMGLSAILSL